MRHPTLTNKSLFNRQKLLQKPIISQNAENDIVSPKNNQEGFIHDASVTRLPQQDLHRDNNSRHANR